MNQYTTIKYGLLILLIAALWVYADIRHNNSIITENNAPNFDAPPKLEINNSLVEKLQMKK